MNEMKPAVPRPLGAAPGLHAYVPIDLRLDHYDTAKARPTSLKVRSINNEIGAVTLPIFCCGDGSARARFQPTTPGTYLVEVECEDSVIRGDPFVVQPADSNSEHPWYRHGALRVADAGTHLLHEDGTPFFWYADTWWNGVSSRIAYPDDYRRLVRNRADNGFTAVLFNVGCPPILDPFDDRGASPSGLAWDAVASDVNRAYYDDAERRLLDLFDAGFVVGIVGGWGYALSILGRRAILRQWRHLVARFSAFPVVWILAGETEMAWFETRDRTHEEERLTRDWARVGRFVSCTDAHERLISTHPKVHPGSSRVAMPRADRYIDFDMIQCGHWKAASIPHGVTAVRQSATLVPRKPVLMAEPAYEGVFGDCWQDHQRFQFWAFVLSGSLVGFTYGASGLWEANTSACVASVAPNGITWSTTPWQASISHAGARQLGYSVALLQHIPWFKLTPAQERVTPRWDGEQHAGIFSAAGPDGLLTVYFPAMYPATPDVYLGNETGTVALLFDPIRGAVFEADTVALSTVVRTQRDTRPGWLSIPRPPLMQDWVYLRGSRDLVDRVVDSCDRDVEGVEGGLLIETLPGFIGYARPARGAVGSIQAVTDPWGGTSRDRSSGEK